MLLFKHCERCYDFWLPIPFVRLISQNQGQTAHLTYREISWWTSTCEGGQALVTLLALQGPHGSDPLLVIGVSSPVVSSYMAAILCDEALGEPMPSVKVQWLLRWWLVAHQRLLFWASSRAIFTSKSIPALKDEQILNNNKCLLPDSGQLFFISISKYLANISYQYFSFGHTYILCRSRWEVWLRRTWRLEETKWEPGRASHEFSENETL